MFFRTYKNWQFRKLFYINNHHSYQKTFQENMEIIDEIIETIFLKRKVLFKCV